MCLIIDLINKSEGSITLSKRFNYISRKARLQ